MNTASKRILAISDFLTNLLYYYELNGHVFVHAGIDPRLSHWKYTDKNDFLWR